MEIMGHVRLFSVFGKKKSYKGSSFKSLCLPILTQEFSKSNALNLTGLLSFPGGVRLALFLNIGEMFSSECKSQAWLLRGGRV